MIDLSRRFFLFGAAATVILPPKRTFYFLKPQVILPADLKIDTPARLFDLPKPYELALVQRILDQTYVPSDIPRWVVLDQQWLDGMIAAEKKHGWKRKPRPQPRDFLV